MNWLNLLVCWLNYLGVVDGWRWFLHMYLYRCLHMRWRMLLLLHMMLCDHIEISIDRLIMMCHIGGGHVLRMHLLMHVLLLLLLILMLWWIVRLWMLIELMVLRWQCNRIHMIGDMFGGCGGGTARQHRAAMALRRLWRLFALHHRCWVNHTATTTMHSVHL